jgi:hypothetical protein
MNESIVISKDASGYIELIHRKSNPTVWIVRRWKKRFWLKKQVSSDWFTNAQQARLFAHKLKLAGSSVRP